MRLARALLFHDRKRLLTSISGIGFAVLLMLLQLGFRSSLVDSSTALLEAVDGDVFVTHKDKQTFLERDSIPRERLFQALSVPGVAAAYPLWMDQRYWKNLADGTQRPIRVLGFVPGDPVFRLADVRRAADALARPDTVLVDRKSRSYYGVLRSGPAQVERHALDVVGTFAIGTDLESDGNLIVGEQTFRRIARTPPGRIEVATVFVEPGADAAAVAQAMRAVLPGDVSVLTREELRLRDIEYWDTGTPVSIVVMIGLVVGFVVGVVICYQVLYTEIADHLPELATLRAMGYGGGFLALVVVAEAILLSVAALLPSLAVGALLYAVLEAVTGLRLDLTIPRIVLVSTLTLSMCIVAGLLALRRVQQADPAELF
jgi:putative ABC transport system permease protein